jgi:hypothetical protein
MCPAGISSKELEEILGSRIKFRVGNRNFEGVLVYRGKRLCSRKDAPHYSFVSDNPIKESQPFSGTTLRKNGVYETIKLVRMLEYKEGIRVSVLRRELDSLE